MAFTQSEAIVSQLFQSSFGRQVASMPALTGWVGRYESKLNGNPDAVPPVEPMTPAQAQQSILNEMNT